MTSARSVAEQFLSALEDRRWTDAARLVDPRTALMFVAQHRALRRFQSGDEEESTETRFPGPFAQLGDRDKFSALDPVPALARFLEAQDPASILAQAGNPDAPATRLILAACSETGDHIATARFIRDSAAPEPPGGRLMTLLEIDGAWRITDVDVAPLGGGYLVLNNASFARLLADFQQGDP